MNTYRQLVLNNRVVKEKEMKKNILIAIVMVIVVSSMMIAIDYLNNKIGKTSSRASSTPTAIKPESSKAMDCVCRQKENDKENTVSDMHSIILFRL